MVCGIRSVIERTWREFSRKQGLSCTAAPHVPRRHPILPVKAAICLLLLPPLLIPLPASAQKSPQIPPGTSPVPMEVQDMVEDSIAKNLPLPETADWHFDFMAPYPGGGNVVCGSVNYQSLERKFVGSNRFYAIVYRNKVSFTQLQDPPSVDVSGEEARKFHLFCDRISSPHP